MNWLFTESRLKSNVEIGREVEQDAILADAGDADAGAGEAFAQILLLLVHVMADGRAA